MTKDCCKQKNKKTTNTKSDPTAPGYAQEIKNKANDLEGMNPLKEEIEELKKNLDEANEKTEIAEKLASDFQNKLYDLQLKNIELEQELNYIKASGKLLK